MALFPPRPSFMTDIDHIRNGGEKGDEMRRKEIPDTVQFYRGRYLLNPYTLK